MYSTKVAKLTKKERNVLTKWYDVDGQYIDSEFIRGNVGRNVLESAFPQKAFSRDKVGEFLQQLRAKRAQ